MRIERIQELESYAVVIEFDKHISLKKAAEIIALYEKRFSEKDEIRLKGPFKGANGSSNYHIGNKKLEIFDVSPKAFIVKDYEGVETKYFRKFCSYLCKHAKDLEDIIGV